MNSDACTKRTCNRTAHTHPCTITNTHTHTYASHTQAAPRANIYRRNQASVDVHFDSDAALEQTTASSNAAAAASNALGALDRHHGSDLDGMKALMRFNNYREDQVQLFALVYVLNQEAWRGRSFSYSSPVCATRGFVLAQVAI